MSSTLLLHLMTAHITFHWKIGWTLSEQCGALGTFFFTGEWIDKNQDKARIIMRAVINLRLIHIITEEWGKFLRMYSLKK